MTILLSGFSSFPGAPLNPTEELFLSVQPGAGRDVASVCLPVEWERSYPELRRAIERHRPVRVLMTGLALGAECLRVELIAHRVSKSDRVDAAGRCHVLPLAAGPEAMPARFDLVALGSAMRSAEIPFEWSRNAGAYLCNDVFYRLALDADALGVREFLFLHVPLTDECVAATRDAGHTPPRCRTQPKALIDAAVATIVGTWRQAPSPVTGAAG